MDISLHSISPAAWAFTSCSASLCLSDIIFIWSWGNHGRCTNISKRQWSLYNRICKEGIPAMYIMYIRTYVGKIHQSWTGSNIDSNLLPVLNSNWYQGLDAYNYMVIEILQHTTHMYIYIHTYIYVYMLYGLQHDRDARELKHIKTMKCFAYCKLTRGWRSRRSRRASQSVQSCDSKWHQWRIKWNVSST